MRALRKPIRSFRSIAGAGFLLMLPIPLAAQSSLTLDQCFEQVAVQYPLAGNTTLYEDQLALDLEALDKDRLPKLDLNAQATYQSEVTRVPLAIPNVSIEPPNKDQYRASLEVNQLLYDGGRISASKKLSAAATRVNQQEVAVTLYTLKTQVTELYLSALLLQERKKLLESKQTQLESQLEEVRAGVRFGALLPASADALEVELLKVQQQFSDLDFSRTGVLDRLSLLIGTALPEDVALQRPEVFFTPAQELSRPELALFELQKDKIDRSTEVLTKSNLPKINAFAQGGYGNPGLNMLDNSFNTFFITGLRVQWNLFDWNKTQKEEQSQQLNKEFIEAEKETFDLQTRMVLADLQSEIDKLRQALILDGEIIALQEKIVHSAASQLKNGVITSSAYIVEFTNLYEARNHQTLRQLQLLQKQIHYQLAEGSYSKSF
ncbi:TolC family protein [Robiginitalea marina]|uniref:TolC family protein n=1 Tax=Robiginitalea marina TaxID=2954105 RepID=A0ABT1AYH7_9FLAO|nr:TolC family protein [Robiginitalea marina]MCO5725027.1 TolC family protein [Robiginitalea marina]